MLANEPHQTCQRFPTSVDTTVEFFQGLQIWIHQTPTFRRADRLAVVAVGEDHDSRPACAGSDPASPVLKSHPNLSSA